MHTTIAKTPNSPPSILTYVRIYPVQIYCQPWGLLSSIAIYDITYERGSSYFNWEINWHKFSQPHQWHSYLLMQKNNMRAAAIIIYWWIFKNRSPVCKMNLMCQCRTIHALKLAMNINRQQIPVYKTRIDRHPWHTTQNERKLTPIIHTHLEVYPSLRHCTWDNDW